MKNFCLTAKPTLRCVAFKDRKSVIKKLLELCLFYFSGFAITLAFLNAFNFVGNTALFLGGICILTYIYINNFK